MTIKAKVTKRTSLKTRSLKVGKKLNVVKPLSKGLSRLQSSLRGPDSGTLD
jgi:hypothetical protein